MSQVIAKFKVNLIEQRLGYGVVDGESTTFTLPTVVLNPVYAPDDDDHENHKFWQASPSGELRMVINNPDAAEHFQVGDEFYVTFTRAE